MQQGEAREMVGVCIISQRTKDSDLIDPAVLERLDGLRMRMSFNSTADVLISECGKTIAFDIFHSRDLAGNPQAVWERYSHDLPVSLSISKLLRGGLLFVI